MKNPGFPFCLPRMAPLYTREPPSPRDCVRRTIVQVRRPSLQPTLPCSELEVHQLHAERAAVELRPRQDGDLDGDDIGLHPLQLSRGGVSGPMSSRIRRLATGGARYAPGCGTTITTGRTPACTMNRPCHDSRVRDRAAQSVYGLVFSAAYPRADDPRNSSQCGPRRVVK